MANGIEFNVKDIEVLRSEDGNKYTTVAIILPKGNNSKYEIEANNFSNAFFKLRINDLDGSYTYSQTVQVKSNCDRAILQIMPNPANDVIRIPGINPGDRIVVLDMPGRVEKTFTVMQPSQHFNIKSLVPGVHFIQVIRSGMIVANQNMIKY